MYSLYPRAFFKALFRLLAKVCSYNDVNKMGANNLAIVFGPNILRSKDETALSAIENSAVVNDFAKVLISNFDYVTGN